MRPKTALAFAPAVISNFFAIHNEALYHQPPDFSLVGATGGGFTLSKGVYSNAWVVKSSSRAVSVAVNGDANYPAATTRKAVELLLDGARQPPCLVELVQTVEVPIGAGFGSSSASALSAVMAVAAALELPLSKEQVASYAHEADIVRHTGLGTVSSTYNQSGAALVVRPGGPGVAKLVSVKVPPGHRVLTACLSRKGKKNVLSSKRMETKINRLGAEALEQASDLKLESLLAAGHAFAEGLGLMTRAVSHLVAEALEKGAVGASQNMVGNSMHAVVREEDLESVSTALRSVSKAAVVDSFRIGGRTARILTE
jgi:pantoate kinase